MRTVAPYVQLLLNKSFPPSFFFFLNAPLPVQQRKFPVKAELPVTVGVQSRKGQTLH